MAVDTQILGEELTNYVDIPYDGFSPGMSPVLKGYDCVKNSLKLYLFSNPGDYGRNIEKGGPTLKFIGLPLNESSRIMIQKEIEEALKIYSNIVISNINVTPVVEEKKWKISILFSDVYNKVITDISFSVFTQ